MSCNAPNNIPDSSAGTMTSQCSACPDLQCSLQKINTGSGGTVCQRVYTTVNNAGQITKYNNRVPYPGSTNPWLGWKEGAGREIFPVSNMMDCCSGKYPDAVGQNPEAPTYGQNVNGQCALCWADGSDVCNNAISNWCSQMYNGDLIMGIDEKCKRWKNLHLTDGKYDSMMEKICQGKNLATPTCKAYSLRPLVNIDENIQKYCDSQGDNAINDPNCGCFLKPSVYDNFFKDLSNDLSTAIPPFRTCYFPKCVQSDYKRYQDRQITCPSVNTCLIENKINNDGTINGNVIYDSTNNCTFTNNNSPNPPNPPSPNPPSPPSPNPTPSPPSPSTDNQDSYIEILKKKWNGLSRNESIAVLSVLGVVILLLFLALYKLFKK